MLVSCIYKYPASPCTRSINSIKSNVTIMELVFLLVSSILFFFFLVHNIHQLVRSRRKLPPGPPGLPIIGNLLDLGPKPHESLAKLSKKHGPLMTIRMGSITSVVASTPEAAREVLQRNDEACCGRNVPDAVASLPDNSVALAWIPANEEWRTIRKALSTYLTHQHKLDTLRELRENVMEGMLDFLREAAGRKVQIGKLAFAVALNKMSNTCLSQNVTNYDECDDDIGGFNTAVKTVMQMVGKFNIADIFPVLKALDPQKIRKHGKAAYEWFDRVIEGYITERLKHRESKLPRFGDMLDSLMDFSEANEHPQLFNLKHIKILLMELFLAGTETSSNTTEWAMTELLLNPHMFTRVREEVSTVVGKDGKIQEAKILDLPYLQAVIKETMRLHLAVPLLVPHKTETQVKIGEYMVPKNTQILVNAWAMARDPRYWESPTVFKPERFLGNEIDYRGQHFEFIPFGSGRRMCPGIPLAQRVVSLLVASFVYHFDWKLPYAREEMDMNDIFGLTLIRATPLVATPIPAGPAN